MMPASSLAAAEPRAVRRRLLVAEDDAEMRTLLTSTLRTAGYDVTEAEDGMQLLDRLEAAAVHDMADRYAAVVADIRMPWLSGLDVLAILNAASWHTPVVLITAFGDPETHREGHELGATAVLDKPFEMGDLMRTIAEAIASRTSALRRP